jgi:hypothetical protein
MDRTSKLNKVCSLIARIRAKYPNSHEKASKMLDRLFRLKGILESPEEEVFFLFKDGSKIAKVVSAVIKKTKVKPSRIKVLPRLGVLFIKGSSELVQELRQNDEIKSSFDPQLTEPGIWMSQERPKK